MDLSGELGPPDSVKDLLLSTWIDLFFIFWGFNFVVVGGVSDGHKR